MGSDAAKLFEHLQLIVTMILTLAVGRVLNGFSRILQHPKKNKLYSVHICWAFSMLIFLINFWWWEFKPAAIKNWSFEGCFLVLSSVIVLFLLCSLVFPDNLDDYDGFQDYFMAMRKWFFGVLTLSFLLDGADSILKGAAYSQSLGYEYWIHIVVYIILCVAAMFTKNHRFHHAFVTANLVYQLSYFIRLYFHMV